MFHCQTGPSRDVPLTRHMPATFRTRQNQTAVERKLSPPEKPRPWPRDRSKYPEQPNCRQLHRNLWTMQGQGYACVYTDCVTNCRSLCEVSHCQSGKARNHRAHWRRSDLSWACERRPVDRPEAPAALLALGIPNSCLWSCWCWSAEWEPEPPWEYLCFADWTWRSQPTARHSRTALLKSCLQQRDFLNQAWDYFKYSHDLCERTSVWTFLAITWRV